MGGVRQPPACLSMQSRFEYVFSHSQTSFLLLYNLPPNTIYQLRSMTQTLKRTVDTYIDFCLARAVDDTLDHFFPSSGEILAREFRSVMRYTGAVVGGSAAVQLFDRVKFTGTDLDVYVNKSCA